MIRTLANPGHFRVAVLRRVIPYFQACHGAIAHAVADDLVAFDDRGGSVPAHKLPGCATYGGGLSP